MTEKQIDKMNALADKYAKDISVEHEKFFTTLAFVRGYTAAHNDATAIIEKLEKAIAYYADSNNWLTIDGPGDIREQISDDSKTHSNNFSLGGRRAREAIAELNKWRES